MIRTSATTDIYVSAEKVKNTYLGFRKNSRTQLEICTNFNESLRQHIGVGH